MTSPLPVSLVAWLSPGGRHITRRAGGRWTARRPALGPGLAPRSPRLGAWVRPIPSADPGETWASSYKFLISLGRSGSGFDGRARYIDLVCWPTGPREERESAQGFQYQRLLRRPKRAALAFFHRGKEPRYKSASCSSSRVIPSPPPPPSTTDHGLPHQTHFHLDAPHHEQDRFDGPDGRRLRLRSRRGRTRGGDEARPGRRGTYGRGRGCRRGVWRVDRGRTELPCCWVEV